MSEINQNSLHASQLGQKYVFIDENSSFAKHHKESEKVVLPTLRGDRLIAQTIRYN